MQFVLIEVDIPRNHFISPFLLKLIVVFVIATLMIYSSYTDPVDGSKTSKQGLILNFQFPSGDPARVVFRLSGTGSAGATIRMYLERYEKDSSKHDMSAPAALKDLAEEALKLVQMEKTTGREAPTVIT